MNKRYLLKSIWLVPIITAKTLPSHAQTSICTISEVAGEWSLAIQGSTTGAEIYTLNSDRTGVYDGNAILWNTENNQLIISLNNGTVIQMNLSDNCFSASGTFTESNGAVGNISGSKDGFTN